MSPAEDDAAAVADYARVYEELIGFVPPKIGARLPLSHELDPQLLALQEGVRERAMYPQQFDVKTTQLMLWGILLGQVGLGARWHGVAARRAGASWEELHAVAALAYLFRGLPAMNLAAELLADMRADDPLEVV
jgi:4-carboxymuconolactone decarboxylase